MKYEVIVPIAGYMTTEVEANSEQDAIQQALGKSFSLDFKSEELDLVEIEAYEKIVEGNICYLYEYEASAEEV